MTKTKILTPVLILACGCGSIKKEMIFQTAPIMSQKFIAPVPNWYYNRIQPEDELIIRELDPQAAIFAASVEKNIFRVDADSNIVLPLIGKLKVAGLDRQQAGERIVRAYQEKELNTLRIDLQICNMQVTLLGEVNRQGNYPLHRENYELIDLLGDAQGFSSNANVEALRIFRGDRRKPEVIEVNMTHYSFMNDPRLMLRSGDVVVVPPKVSSLKLKKAQQYSGLAQLGLVLTSTLFILMRR